MTTEERDTRTVAILTAAARLADDPAAPLQRVAAELAPLGIDVTHNTEHLRALATLKTCVMFKMPPSERALAALGCSESAAA